MQSITGQYECVHSSGVGLDYFTSRIDHLQLHADGRFILTVQKRSRVSHAAHSLMSGQQVTAAAPEMRLEGNYVRQDRVVSLHFDNGGVEAAQLSPNGESLQIGPNTFPKVSDSTLIPPTHRLKQDMEDIAKGIQLAKTIGGIATKAAKTIQATIQSTEGTTQTSPHSPPPAPTSSGPQSPPPTTGTVLYCDQCGARSHPGKHFCNKCGARLS